MTTVREIVEGRVMIWRKVQRGGYGFATLVTVTVRRVGAKRVLVEVPLVAGGTREVWISPRSLRESRRTPNEPPC